MSDDKITSNKRIAQNTILLYARMLLTMCISLYTSRVILNVLGVEDYGIYNVVGGVIAMFGFVSNSLSTATQRYITFEIGKGTNGNESKIFSICLMLHLVIAISIVLIADVISVWFLYNKMMIPVNRLNAAFWVLQFSLVSTFVMIISVPFNAQIIAHEKMGAFAMISIIEASLKLVIVYTLLMINYDKLIVYGLLILLTQVAIQGLYMIYCHRHFKNIKFRFEWDKPLIKELSSFAGWSILGNVSYLSYTQGLNILLNMFFLPVVNAARGIALQVQGTVNTFVAGFQTAINPQITKTYAAGEINDMHNLVFQSSRFSFYLLLITSLPVMLEAEPILKVWLGVVPDYTVTFLRLIFLTTWINSFANPLIVSVKASGKVWQYESVVAIIMLAILPVSYVFLRLGFDAWIVFAIHLTMECIAQIARVVITSRLIHFSINKYFNDVLLRIGVVASCSVVVPVIFYVILPSSWISFFIICTLSALSTVSCVYILGISKEEKIFLKNKFMSIFSLKKK